MAEEGPTRSQSADDGRNYLPDRFGLDGARAVDRGDMAERLVLEAVVEALVERYEVHDLELRVSSYEGPHGDRLCR